MLSLVNAALDARDDLRLGRQHQFETVLRLASGIVEQHVLRPSTDVNGKD